MTDWAAWGTSVGTLVLAGATFAAIRSSNRSARIAERSLLAGLQPLLVLARRDDPPEEVQFADGRVFKAGHGTVLFYHESNVIYMALPVRNAGTGIAYLYGYRLEAEPARQVETGNLGAARATDGATWPPTPRASRCNSATCTSRLVRTASGRPPYATPAPPYTPPR